MYLLHRTRECKSARCRPGRLTRRLYKCFPNRRATIDPHRHRVELIKRIREVFPVLRHPTP